MARNGIAIFVDPKLGKTTAGLIWIPVPETGVPEWMLSLTRPGYNSNVLRPIRDALCEANREGAVGVKPIAVSEATWEAVESFAEDLRTNMEVAATKTAEANAECDALIAEYEAAIASPEPSRLLTRDEAPWGHDWGTLDKHVSGADIEHLAALDRARNAAQSEAGRRTRASALAFADTATDDEFMAAFVLSDAYRFNLLERMNRIESERDELAEAAKRSAIRARLADAPAHIIERFDAGRLPDDELMAALADALFGSIHLPQYEKIEDDEVEHGDDCCGPEIKVKSREYTGELDAEEWESWKAVTSALESAGLEPKLRIVTAYCTDTDCHGSVSRLQARVEAEVGGLTVLRSYAVE